VSDGRITWPQWKGLIAAWLGWAFDGLDGYLYVLVATPFVASLLGKPASDPDVAFKGAVINGFFLLGWAVGGAVFGRIGDRLGRARTLTYTILTYAVFTGLACVVQTWWQLLIVRFVAALGIGGEWAAGSALVAEMLHRKHRTWASAALQSGYMIGMMLAALTTNGLSSVSPRWVFLVGVAPALMTVWIRRAVPEPEVWHGAAKTQAMPPVAALFAPGLRRTTLLVLSLTSVALTTVWAFLFFAPQAVRVLPETAAWDPMRKARLLMWVTIFFTCINIGGNFAGTYLARAVGHRVAFFVMLLGSLASYLLFWVRPSLGSIYWQTGVAAFFSLGLFGMFPLYIPPLFPTLLRTLGAGFTYNVGRLIAGIGTFFGGAISAYAGGPHRAIFWTGFLYIAGLAVSLFIPEVREAEESREGMRRCSGCQHDLSGVPEDGGSKCPECGAEIAI
jgi:predicted MFS family arabinose efflux permease